MFSQSDIDRSVNARAQVEHSNQTELTMRTRILSDYKCVIAVALLKAFTYNCKTNAPLFESQMRKDHILVAATASAPAKPDGCAISRG